jgi:hypothetical protein
MVASNMRKFVLWLSAAKKTNPQEWGLVALPIYILAS